MAKQRNYYRDYYQAHKTELAARRKAWYQAHKEQGRAIAKAYRDKHKAELKVKNKAYNDAHKEELKALHRAYYLAHRVEKQEGDRQRNQAFKLEVFQHYSGEQPKCAHCGEDDMDVLQIDHIANDGAKQRKKFGRYFAGSQFYRWLKNEGYPEGYQVLCANCNLRKELLRRRKR